MADDASTDGTADWLSSTYPGVRLVRLERNGGFCAAANAGLTASRGRFVQLLNNDTEVTEGWIEAGLAPFVDATVGSVAPLVLVRLGPGTGRLGRRYVCHRGLAGQARPWPTDGSLGRSSRRRGVRGQWQQCLLSRRGASPVRWVRSPIRLVLRGHRPGLPPAVGGLPLRLHARLSDSSRRLRHLRPSESQATTTDVAQRRAGLLVEPARSYARPGRRAPPGVSCRTGSLAIGPRPSGPVRCRQARRAPSLATDTRAPACSRGDRSRGDPTAAFRTQDRLDRGRPQSSGTAKGAFAKLIVHPLIRSRGDRLSDYTGRSTISNGKIQSSLTGGSIGQKQWRWTWNSSNTCVSWRAGVLQSGCWSTRFETISTSVTTLLCL